MEEIIKNFIIDELGIEKNQSSKNIKIILNIGFNLRIATVFTIPLELVDKYINEIINSHNN
jgi:hypothetical protein